MRHERLTELESLFPGTGGLNRETVPRSARDYASFEEIDVVVLVA
jgi:hypothetical protein